MADVALNSAVNVQVSCITKRGDHYNPHERIQGLGGVHNGQRWWMSEDDIIAELERGSIGRQWNFYVSVNRKAVCVGRHEELTPHIASIGNVTEDG